ncbi:EST/SMG-like protein 1 [Cladorrhinum sp. PSN259]|nr:EST/SMG-like protein 1 [Cladorrhinum sp. PSN259]
MDITKKWNEHLRRQTQKPKSAIKCPQLGCNHDFQHPSTSTVPPDFAEHFRTAHSQELSDKVTDQEQKDFIQQRWVAAASAEKGPASGKPAPAGDNFELANRRRHAEPDTGPPRSSAVAQTDRARERDTRSPTPSIKREGSRSRSTSPPKRAKARHNDDLDRRPPVRAGKLWSPDDDTTTSNPRPFDKSNVASSQRLRLSSASNPKLSRQPHLQPRAPPPVEVEETMELIKQPETRPISQEQLVAEVKGIYAGLVMVESKCIEVDNAQSQQNDPTNKLNHDQWQALIALHRTLLHEHHDFFLASQHPSASPALRRLASKYAMPARMWRHGIHSFLELLRHRLPASLEHMLMFIYLAYSMMALLYETVPAFEDTWIECLGDLGRYRMAIEDDDIRDRENWTAVSRHWYSKASDKAPTTGRLYHHLAILARPNALQQLYYYTKSLCVAIPFVSARDSIMTLFDPIMAVTPNQQQTRLPPVDLAFTKTHGIMFSGKQQEKLKSSKDDFLQALDSYIARSTKRWLEPGYHIALTNCCAVVGYGDATNPIFKAIQQIRSEEEAEDQPMHEDTVSESTSKQLEDALMLFIQTYDIVCRRFGDPNILPYLNTTLVFVYHLTFYPEAISRIASKFPWKLTATMLNTLIDSCKNYTRIEGDYIPHSESNPRPLPEDFAMRGLLWADKVYTSDWFVNDKIDDDEKYFEVASMAEERKDRVLWLGCKIAALDGQFLRYDSQTHQFTVAPQYDLNLETTMPLTPVDSLEMGELPDAVTPA